MARHRSQWYRPQSIVRSIAIRPKVYLAVLAAAVAAYLLPAAISGSFRTAIAADVGAIIYLLLSLRLMQACSSAEMRRRAAMQDEGAGVILALVVVAVAVSFWTIFGVLNEAKQAAGTGRAIHVSLAAATILLLWLVTQMLNQMGAVVDADAGGNANDAHGGGAFFGILTARALERHVERRAAVQW